jgi:hypothetical protein
VQYSHHNPIGLLLFEEVAHNADRLSTINIVFLDLKTHWLTARQLIEVQDALIIYIGSWFKNSLVNALGHSCGLGSGRRMGSQRNKLLH